MHFFKSRSARLERHDVKNLHRARRRRRSESRQIHFHRLGLESLEPRLMLAADAFEDNDTFATATDIGSGSFARTGLSICTAFDDDYYRVVAAASGTLTVDVIFAHALGDIDIALYDSTTAFLTSSTSVTNVEQVSWAVVAGDIYYIRVYGFNGALNSNYSLQITSPSPFEDGFEQNDTQATASNIGSGDWSASGLTINAPNDDDYYRWYAADNGTLTVTATFAHGVNNDVDFSILSASGSVLTGSYSVTDNEQASVAVTAGNYYYVDVYGHNSGVHHDYDLSFDGPDIPADYFENNDTLATATYLGSGDLTYSGLTIDAPRDNDWYEWVALNSGNLTVTANFTHAINNDVDIVILNSGGTLLGSSTSVTDNEQTTIAVVAGGHYFLNVYGFVGDVHHNYSISFDGPDTVIPDYFENNDTQLTATALGTSSQAHLGLTVEPSDDDWYHWTAIQNGTLVIDATFRHAVNNDVDMTFHTAAGAFLAGSGSVTDNERITHWVNGGSSYLTRVYGFAGDYHHDYALIYQFYRAGDYDLDGDVDGDDFLTWQASFGVNAGGDADNDGDTDGDDFLIWQSNFGSAAGGGSALLETPGASGPTRDLGPRTLERIEAAYDRFDAAPLRGFDAAAFPLERITSHRHAEAKELAFQGFGKDIQRDGASHRTSQLSSLDAEWITRLDGRLAK